MSWTRKCSCRTGARSCSKKAAKEGELGLLGCEVREKKNGRGGREKAAGGSRFTGEGGDMVTVVGDPLISLRVGMGDPKRKRKHEKRRGVPGRSFQGGI